MNIFSAGMIVHRFLVDHMLLVKIYVPYICRKSSSSCSSFSCPEYQCILINEFLILLRTKRLVVDVVACQTGDTLVQILDTPASEEQVRANSG